MNKKYVLCGVLFWAAVSGYMGLRILDSYTEDAVAAALSGIPATAEEIKYSFLRNSLAITGLEYDIPHETVQRKGRIERIEVQNFNRKILFVLPRMAEYSPEILPRVAERVTFSGWKDTLHEHEVKIISSIAQVTVEGWHQRLGLVLDQYARYGVGKRFFEELMRCRMAQAVATGISVEKKAEGTGKLSIARVFLPKGILPPAMDEKMHAQDVALEKLAFSSPAASFSSGSMSIQGALLPDPENLERLMAGDGWRGWTDFSFSLAEAYGSRTPFSRISMSGVSVVDAVSGEKLDFEGASCSLERKNGFLDAGFAVQAARGFFRNWQGASSFVQEGEPALDATLTASLRSDAVKSDVRCTVRGLGEMEFLSQVKGDMRGILQSVTPGQTNFTMKKFAAVTLEKAKFRYADTGLFAFLLGSQAKKDGKKPDVLLEEYVAVASAMAQGKGQLQAQAGRVIQEQLGHPGEIMVELQHPLPVPSLAMALLISPDQIPLSIQSAPGAKSLQDYFPR